MKTIEGERTRLSEIAGDGKNMFCIGFDKGVEFAQKWIPVEEELPAKTTFVIARKNNGIDLGLYFNADGEFMCGRINQTSQVTHWRPIERK